MRVRIRFEDIIETFNQAWVELRCPPVRLSIIGEDDGGRDFIVANGVAYVGSNIVPEGCDPRKYLLWYFRRELAHVHYCPYDLKTAYSLEKMAYTITGDWDLAYLATHLFADLQVDINYLPKRFDEIPYFMKVIRREYPSLLDFLLHGVYLQINPIYKLNNKTVENASKEILAIAILDKPWHVKVCMIAAVLLRLRRLYPNLFSKTMMEKSLRRNIIPVREDFLPSSIKSFEEVFGRISTSPDAEKFFRQWIEPRIPQEERERARKMIEEKAKGLRREIGRKEKSGELGDREKREFMLEIGDKGKFKETEQIMGRYGQGEPLLPSSLSRPYEKISSSIFKEAFWKRYWYRSRAENTIMYYLFENPFRRPMWSVVKYPEDWYIEDEIEELDLDISLDEGPLIPEVTTLKWVEEPSSHGQSIVTGYVPSQITILDASLSMLKIHDEAAVAAFIAYLSAHKSGGQTSAITFSTRYLSADWNSPSDLKELTLSIKFDEYTIFPIYEVKRLISENIGNCFIIIITDGGWQNIDEVIPILEDIANSGHKITIFLLPGGDYPEKISLIRRKTGIKVYEVNNPERDLQGLVLSESIRTYRAFI